jgi:hypothetical protein
MRRTPGRYFFLSSFVAVFLVGGLISLAQPQAATPAAAQPPGPFRVSAIQIQQIQADEVKLPAEFQAALYEHVVEQVINTKRIPHVYRDGDHNAAGASDLVTLHSTVTGFKQGSARARQVTTVAGATDIKVHLQFTDKAGKSILESDVDGRVRFFGENLRATFDFGKKVAAVVRQNFMAPAPAAQ